MEFQPTLLENGSDVDTASGSELEAAELRVQRCRGVPRAAVVAVSVVGLLALLSGVAVFANHSGPTEAKASDTVQLSFADWFASSTGSQGQQNSAPGASSSASSFLSNILGGNKNAATGSTNSASSFLSGLLGGGSSPAQGNRNVATPAGSPPSQNAIIDWVKNALTKADAAAPMQGAPSQGSNVNANFLSALAGTNSNMQQGALSLLSALGQKDNGRGGAPAVPGLNSLMAQAHSAGLDLGQFVPQNSGVQPGGAAGGSKPSGGFFNNVLGGVLGSR